MAFLTEDDLSPFAQIQSEKAIEMINDATALAVLAAPCLANEDDLDDGQKAAVKAILRGAILRWNEVRAGALMSENAGPFGQSFDNGNNRRSGMFWKSEIDQLQSVCRLEAEASGAFAVDTYYTASSVTHADVCSVNFGAEYCSCGADLSMTSPLWEMGGRYPYDDGYRF